MTAPPRGLFGRAARLGLRFGSGLGFGSRLGFGLALGLGLTFAPPRPATAADSLREQVAALGSGNGRQRSLAYRELVRTPNLAVIPILRKEVPGFDFWGQHYGVLVLDRFGSLDSRRAWKGFLKADSPYLRLCAATALLRSGDEGGLDAALAALTNPDVPAPTRVRMILRLGKRPHRRLMDGVRTLCRSGQDPAVLESVLTLLHARRDRPGTQFAKGVLADSRATARAMAAAYLIAMGERTHAVDLARAIREAPGRPTLLFVDRLCASRSELEDVVLAALTERLTKETNATLLRMHIASVRRHGYGKALPALRKLLEHRDANLARAAFEAILALGDRLGHKTLEPLLRSEDVERGLWAAEALRRRDDPAGLATVIWALQAGSVAQRTAAVRILGGYRSDHAVEPLLDALSDPHARVRGTALGTLQGVLRILFPYRFLDLGTTGYTAGADEATRAAGIERIRAWWKSHRQADW